MPLKSTEHNTKYRNVWRGGLNSIGILHGGSMGLTLTQSFLIDGLVYAWELKKQLPKI